MREPAAPRARSPSKKLDTKTPAIDALLDGGVPSKAAHAAEAGTSNESTAAPAPTAARKVADGVAVLKQVYAQALKATISGGSIDAETVAVLSELGAAVVAECMGTGRKLVAASRASEVVGVLSKVPGALEATCGRLQAHIEAMPAVLQGRVLALVAEGAPELLSAFRLDDESFLWRLAAAASRNANSAGAATARGASPAARRQALQEAHEATSQLLGMILARRLRTGTLQSSSVARELPEAAPLAAVFDSFLQPQLQDLARRAAGAARAQAAAAAEGAAADPAEQGPATSHRPPVHSAVATLFGPGILGRALAEHELHVAAALAAECAAAAVHAAPLEVGALSFLHAETAFQTQATSSALARQQARAAEAVAKASTERSGLDASSASDASDAAAASNSDAAPGAADSASEGAHDVASSGLGRGSDSRPTVASASSSAGTSDAFLAAARKAQEQRLETLRRLLGLLRGQLTSVLPPAGTDAEADAELLLRGRGATSASAAQAESPAASLASAAAAAALPATSGLRALAVSAAAQAVGGQLSMAQYTLASLEELHVAWLSRCADAIRAANAAAHASSSALSALEQTKEAPEADSPVASRGKQAAAARSKLPLEELAEAAGAPSFAPSTGDAVAAAQLAYACLAAASSITAQVLAAQRAVAVALCRKQVGRSGLRLVRGMRDWAIDAAAQHSRIVTAAGAAADAARAAGAPAAALASLSASAASKPSQASALLSTPDAVEALTSGLRSFGRTADACASLLRNHSASPLPESAPLIVPERQAMLVGTRLADVRRRHLAARVRRAKAEAETLAQAAEQAADKAAAAKGSDASEWEGEGGSDGGSHLRGSDVEADADADSDVEVYGSGSESDLDIDIDGAIAAAAGGSAGIVAPASAADSLDAASSSDGRGLASRLIAGGGAAVGDETALTKPLPSTVALASAAAASDPAAAASTLANAFVPSDAMSVSDLAPSVAALLVPTPAEAAARELQVREAAMVAPLLQALAELAALPQLSGVPVETNPLAHAEAKSKAAAESDASGIGSGSDGEHGVEAGAGAGAEAASPASSSSTSAQVAPIVSPLSHVYDTVLSLALRSGSMAAVAGVLRELAGRSLALTPAGLGDLVAAQDVAALSSLIAAGRGSTGSLAVFAERKQRQRAASAAAESSSRYEAQGRSSASARSGSGSAQGIRWESSASASASGSGSGSGSASSSSGSGRSGSSSSASASDSDRGRVAHRRAAWGHSSNSEYGSRVELSERPSDGSGTDAARGQRHGQGWRPASASAPASQRQSQGQGQGSFAAQQRGHDGATGAGRGPSPTRGDFTSGSGSTSSRAAVAGGGAGRSTAELRRLFSTSAAPAAAAHASAATSAPAKPASTSSSTPASASGSDSESAMELPFASDPAAAGGSAASQPPPGQGASRMSPLQEVQVSAFVLRAPLSVLGPEQAFVAAAARWADARNIARPQPAVRGRQGAHLRGANDPDSPWQLRAARDLTAPAGRADPAAAEERAAAAGKLARNHGSQPQSEAAWRPFALSTPHVPFSQAQWRTLLAAARRMTVSPLAAMADPLVLHRLRVNAALDTFTHIDWASQPLLLEAQLAQQAHASFAAGLFAAPSSASTFGAAESASFFGGAVPVAGETIADSPAATLSLAASTAASRAFLAVRQAGSVSSSAASAAPADAAHAATMPGDPGAPSAVMTAARQAVEGLMSVPRFSHAIRLALELSPSAPLKKLEERAVALVSAAHSAAATVTQTGKLPQSTALTPSLALMNFEAATPAAAASSLAAPPAVVLLGVAATVCARQARFAVANQGLRMLTSAPASSASVAQEAARIVAALAASPAPAATGSGAGAASGFGSSSASGAGAGSQKLAPLAPLTSRAAWEAASHDARLSAVAAAVATHCGGNLHWASEAISGAFTPLIAAAGISGDLRAAFEAFQALQEAAAASVTMAGLQWKDASRHLRTRRLLLNPPSADSSTSGASSASDTAGSSDASPSAKPSLEALSILRWSPGLFVEAESALINAMARLQRHPQPSAASAPLLLLPDPAAPAGASPASGHDAAFVSEALLAPTGPAHPSFKSFAALVRACVATGQPNRASRVLATMNTVMPHVTLYQRGLSELMSAFAAARKPDRAYTVALEAASKGVLPYQSAWVALASAYAEEGRTLAALRAMREAQLAGCWVMTDVTAHDGFINVSGLPRPLASLVIWDVMTSLRRAVRAGAIRPPAKLRVYHTPADRLHIRGVLQSLDPILMAASAKDYDVKRHLIVDREALMAFLTSPDVGDDDDAGIDGPSSSKSGGRDRDRDRDGNRKRPPHRTAIGEECCVPAARPRPQAAPAARAFAAYTTAPPLAVADSPIAAAFVAALSSAAARDEALTRQTDRSRAFRRVLAAAFRGAVDAGRSNILEDEDSVEGSVEGSPLAGDTSAAPASASSPAASSKPRAAASTAKSAAAIALSKPRTAAALALMLPPEELTSAGVTADAEAAGSMAAAAAAASGASPDAALAAAQWQRDTAWKGAAAKAAAARARAAEEKAAAAAAKAAAKARAKAARSAEAEGGGEPLLLKARGKSARADASSLPAAAAVSLGMAGSSTSPLSQLEDAFNADALRRPARGMSQGRGSRGQARGRDGFDDGMDMDVGMGIDISGASADGLSSAEDGDADDYSAIEAELQRVEPRAARPKRRLGGDVTPADAAAAAAGGKGKARGRSGSAARKLR